MLFSVALQRLRRLLRLLLLLRATCLRRVCYMIATPLSPHSGCLPGCCLPWQLVRALISILKRLYKIQQAAIQRAKQQQQTKSRHNPPCSPAPPNTPLCRLPSTCHQHRLHASSCASHTDCMSLFVVPYTLRPQTQLARQLHIEVSLVLCTLGLLI